MQKENSIKIINFVLILSLLLVLECCSQRQTYSFHTNLGLADGGMVSMIVEADFKDAAGVNNIKNKIEEIKFALYLVFSRQKPIN